MKEKLLKEVKKLLENKELTREEMLLELFTNEVGNLDLSHLDFSDFEGDVFIDNMEVKGSLIQDFHEVKGNLYQSNQKVKGNLYQSKQKVEGHYFSFDIKVKGEMAFEEPTKMLKTTKMLKKITLKELEEMGYELEE